MSSDTPETLADALAAARKMLDEDSWIDEATALDEDGEPDDFAQRVVRANDVREALDRIESAAEREYAEAKDYFAKLHDGPSMICTAKNCAVRDVGISLAAPGNSAAMREALEWAAQFLELGVDDDLGADGQNLTTAAEMARDALAAPARNCDLFGDCNSAWRAYNAIANRERLPGFDFWLFAPAEGEAK